MGSIIAFKGIANSMTLLHGSQGCSTYMRLHLVHHFREPVDVGSSALSERGAVYGGAANLKKGLKNIIQGYNPTVIGVATTCLAELWSRRAPNYTLIPERGAYGQWNLAYNSGFQRPAIQDPTKRGTLKLSRRSFRG